MTESENNPNPVAVVEPSAPKPRRGWCRRWARRAFLTTLIVLLLAAAGVYVVTRPAVLTPLLERQLSSTLGADVEITRATWRWSGGVELTGLTIDLYTVATGADENPVADQSGGYDRLLEVQRLDVGLKAAALGRGALHLTDVQIDAPVLRIVEDPETGSVNLRQWLFAPGGDTGEETQPLALPASVRIRDGLIQVERLVDGTPVELGAMRINGTLSPTPPDGEPPASPGVQYLLLEQTDPPTPGQAPLRITGRFDPSEPRLDLEVKDFDLTRPLGLVASPELRRLWAELDPRGALPTLRGSFADDGQGRGLTLEQAELVLHDLSVSIPVETLGLTDELREAVTDDPDLRAAKTADVESEPNEALPYDIRMTEVGGRFVLADGALHVENFSGLIEGLRYQVDGHAVLNRQGELQLRLRTETFELPEEPPFILRLPAAVREIYGEYRPRGRFRASVDVERRAGESLRYDGRIELIDASAAFHKFPYPLRGVNGTLTFDETSLAFDTLRSRGPDGGEITLTGRVTEPGPHAKADIDIAFRDLPVDEHLVSALDSDARKALGMFMHRPSYERLLSRDLIGRGAANDEARSFDFDNTLNGQVQVSRDLDVAPRSQITTTVDPAGLRVVFEHFPYPVTVDGGRLVVRDLHIEVDDLRLRGLTGLTGAVHGELTREKGEPFRPDLYLEHLRGPVDATLRAALPEVADQWLTDLKITGELDAGVHVSAHENGKTAFRVDGQLVQGRAQPFDGGFVLNGLRARFEVTPDATRIVHATGTRDGALLDVSATIHHAASASGAEGQTTAATDPEEPKAVAAADIDVHANRSPPAAPLVNLAASATQLNIEPAVADLIPPGVAARDAVLALFEKFEPTGRTDASFSLTIPRSSASEVGNKSPSLEPTAEAVAVAANAGAQLDPGTRFSLTLEPDHASVVHAGHRVVVRDMTGRVHVSDDHARVEALRGQLDEGWAAADGVVALGNRSDTALLLSGRLPADAPLLQATVPSAAAAAIRGLELRGPVRLEAARLLIRGTPDATNPDRAATDDRPAVEFDAGVDFLGNTATLGVPITELRGTLDTSVRTFAGDRPTELRLELDAKRLRAANRVVESLTGTLTNLDHPGWLAIERFAGRVYGGQLTADGGVPLDGIGRYRVDVSLQEAALGPFLEPLADADAHPGGAQNENTNPPTSPPGDFGSEANNGTAEPTGHVERSLATGVFSANLVLEADLSEPSSRRGRGTILVRNAKLFNTQTGIGALRLLNFAAPTDQPLDRATAKFLVEGDTVSFDTLEVAGPGLAITGSGTMTYPETELDLTLFTRNKDAPKLGPLSDFLDAIKDELIAIRVTGTLADPQPRVTSLSGVRNTTNRVLPVLP